MFERVGCGPVLDLARPVAGATLPLYISEEPVGTRPYERALVGVSTFEAQGEVNSCVAQLKSCSALRFWRVCRWPKHRTLRPIRPQAPRPSAQSGPKRPEFARALLRAWQRHNQAAGRAAAGPGFPSLSSRQADRHDCDRQRRYDGVGSSQSPAVRAARQQCASGPCVTGNPGRTVSGDRQGPD